MKNCLLKSNYAVNAIQRNIESMMKISAPYGEKMGAMGMMPWNSAGGAGFARQTAEMIVDSPSNTQGILDMIKKKATSAGMSESHMERLGVLESRVWDNLGGWEYGDAHKLKWI